MQKNDVSRHRSQKIGTADRINPACCLKTSKTTASQRLVTRRLPTQSPAAAVAPAEREDLSQAQKGALSHVNAKWMGRQVASSKFKSIAVLFRLIINQCAVIDSVCCLLNAINHDWDAYLESGRLLADKILIDGRLLPTRRRGWSGFEVVSLFCDEGSPPKRQRSIKIYLEIRAFLQLTVNCEHLP